VLIRSEDLRRSPDAAFRANNEGQFRKPSTIFLRSRLNARKHALQESPELDSEPSVFQDRRTRVESRATHYLELTETVVHQRQSQGLDAWTVRLIRQKAPGEIEILVHRAETQGVDRWQAVTV